MAQKLTWRTQNDTDASNEKFTAATINEDPSMTMQSFTEDADINTIIRRYGIKDGAIPPANMDWPELDLSDLEGMDLATVMERTRRAEDAFNSLPADVRSRFDNRMTKLWDAFHDPNRTQEMVDLGFLVPEPPSNTPAPQPPIDASNPTAG